ncbi:hypothetical protein FG87_24930 [Nocardia vulneris]|uniref:Uncharacterized protein n=2 Tax=Nocardia vulneris TaxID=1141657 RepID=A0ABR4ZAZ7_9NOCA|nr:hypothetical protein FG87_24930 [Nocardia vulneris]
MAAGGWSVISTAAPMNGRRSVTSSAGIDGGLSKAASSRAVGSAVRHLGHVRSWFMPVSLMPCSRSCGHDTRDDSSYVNGMESAVDGGTSAI